MEFQKPELIRCVDLRVWTAGECNTSNLVGSTKQNHSQPLTRFNQQLLNPVLVGHAGPDHLSLSKRNSKLDSNKMVELTLANPHLPVISNLCYCWNCQNPPGGFRMSCPSTASVLPLKPPPLPCYSSTWRCEGPWPSLGGSQITHWMPLDDDDEKMDEKLKQTKMGDDTPCHRVESLAFQTLFFINDISMTINGSRVVATKGADRHGDFMVISW